MSTREPTPSERAMIARRAALLRWAHEPDRTSATSRARAGLDEKFEDEVDPDRQLLPAERAKRVDAARRAYFTDLALKSAQARRRRKRDA